MSTKVSYTHPQVEVPPSCRSLDIVLEIHFPRQRIAKKNSCRTFLRIIFLLIVPTILLTIIGFGPLALLAPSIIHPPKIQIESVLVSPINTSNSHIKADWTIGMWVRNPNQFNPITYKDLEVSTFYGTNDKYWLAKDTVAPFCQKSKSEIIIVAKPKARSEDVSGLIVLGGDMFGSMVNFNIRMLVKTETKYKCFFGTYKCSYLYGTDRRTYQVLCDDIKVEFSSNGTQGTMAGGGRKKCSVYRA